jgi:hypothetical protein
VEVGSNTSTVTLRVVGGDEKGSLKSETVKYGHESKGTRTREKLCWRGPVAYTKDRPVFSSEHLRVQGREWSMSLVNCEGLLLEYGLGQRDTKWLKTRRLHSDLKC